MYPIGIVVLWHHPPTPAVLAYAVAAGVLSSAVPFLVDLLSLRRVSAQFFGVFMSVNPVLAARARSWLLHRERRDALLASLERHLAGEYHVDVPHGGHHLWVTLTRPLDERALYSEAARNGVMFTPGGAVTAERRSQTSFRLSFSLLDPPELDEGVRRLARSIREVRRRARHAVAAPMS